VGNNARRDLPEALASRLTVDRQAMRLDLSNCSVDVVRLQEVARQCADQKGMLTSDLVAEARRMLDETDGEFLPGSDEIEAEANGGQGAAKECPRPAGGGRNGAGRPHRRPGDKPSFAAGTAQGNPPIREGFGVPAEREDLTRKLLAAYLETGQRLRAAQLQRDHALEV